MQRPPLTRSYAPIVYQLVQSCIRCRGNQDAVRPHQVLQALRRLARNEHGAPRSCVPHTCQTYVPHAQLRTALIGLHATFTVRQSDDANDVIQLGQM